MTLKTSILLAVTVLFVLVGIWSHDEGEIIRCVFTGLLFGMLTFGSWIYDDYKEMERRNRG